jgi:hypothetical protein
MGRGPTGQRFDARPAEGGVTQEADLQAVRSSAPGRTRSRALPSVAARRDSPITIVLNGTDAPAFGGIAINHIRLDARSHRCRGIASPMATCGIGAAPPQASGRWPRASVGKRTSDVEFEQSSPSPICVIARRRSCPAWRDRIAAIRPGTAGVRPGVATAALAAAEDIAGAFPLKMVFCRSARMKKGCPAR